MKFNDRKFENFTTVVGSGDAGFISRLCPCVMLSSLCHTECLMSRNSSACYFLHFFSGFHRLRWQVAMETADRGQTCVYLWSREFSLVMVCAYACLYVCIMNLELHLTGAFQPCCSFLLFNFQDKPQVQMLVII